MNDLLEVPYQAPCAITGLGWVTPLGDSISAVWDQLLLGRSGVQEVPSELQMRSELAAAVLTVPMEMDPHERNVTFALRAIESALKDSGADLSTGDVALILGTSYAGNLDDPEAISLYEWADEVAHRVGYPGKPLCVTTACSAGSDAVLMGAELIRSGTYQVCVCVGTDVVTDAKRLGHSALGTMSSTGLRSFDANHDGMVLGEGAGVLVLEAEQHARSRSAHIQAWLRGAGSANDAAGMTAPDPSGSSVVLAVQRALAGTGLDTSSIDIISAHATGTPVNDAVEAASFRKLFGSACTGPTVFATKGALGHSLGACGTVEAITVIQALKSQAVPPVHHLEEPMDDFPLPLPAGAPRLFDGDVGLSLTLGFGGFNTALILSREGDSRG